MFFLSIIFTALLIVGLVSALTHIKQIKAIFGKILLIGIGILILISGGVHGLFIGLIILLVSMFVPKKNKEHL